MQDCCSDRPAPETSAAVQRPSDAAQQPAALLQKSSATAQQPSAPVEQPSGPFQQPSTLYQQHGKGQPLQHSAGSADTRIWGALSPFLPDRQILLQPVTEAHIASLSQQYKAHRCKSDSNFGLAVLGLAKCVFDRTAGFPGLVGVCCSEIDNKGLMSVQGWFKWGGTNLVQRVQQQRNFAVLCDRLHARCRRNERVRQVMQALL